MHLLLTKTENPAAKNFIICVSIDNHIANISLYALSWPRYGPSFTKGGHKERAVYHVRERRFISP